MSRNPLHQSISRFISVLTCNLKFVVDGTWTTDSRVREENDGHNNVNNVLLPEEIQEAKEPATTEPVATMSGVTPDSTTAALAAGVPKEKTNGDLPGAFPETPGQESEQAFSVNPIPASGGYGNPVKLSPGEKVPEPGTIHGNTVDSTVKLDKESYEKGDSVPLGSAGTQPDTATSSAFAVPPASTNIIPESSLPMGEPAQRAAMTDEEQKTAGAAAADPGITIQSAAPGTTTAALAAGVPLEKDRPTNGTEPTKEVPQVVKDSIAESHQDPEAAANPEVVKEKGEMEQELHKKVDVNESAGDPAPTATAATAPTAPGLTAARGVESSEVSPTSTPPPKVGRGVPPKETTPTTSPNAPVVTTGVASAPTSQVTEPKPAQPQPTTAAAESQADGDMDKKKKRRSWFSKLKEKLK